MSDIPADSDRSAAWSRLSAMAGVDDNGNILPPLAGTDIDRRPNPFWKNRDWDQDRKEASE